MKYTNLVQILEAPKDYKSLAFGGSSPTGGMSQENFDEMSKVFSFHYMGAAEFEFGALPEAVNKVLADKVDYVTGCTKAKWESENWETRKMKKGIGEVFYICHKDHVDEVISRIKTWAKGKHVPPYHTKERVRLDDAFANDCFKGWFEYDNGFLFFTDKEMFEGTKAIFGIGEDK